MPRACDLKKGNVVEINNEIYMVKNIDVKTPSARGAVTLYKVRFANVKTSRNMKRATRETNAKTMIVLEKKPVQYLYPDGNLQVFMDTVEYNQYEIDSEAIEDEWSGLERAWRAL
jgi:elongation factor P